VGEGHPTMVAYEFYLRDRIKGEQLIGILPERRKNAERISNESIMKWARLVFGDTLDLQKIFYLPIRFEKDVPYLRM
jgi:hypothetical protein